MLTHVMIRSRSRQSRSPACDDWTNCADIAASRIMSHPFASHAAGTVSHMLAESDTCFNEKEHNLKFTQTH